MNLSMTMASRYLVGRKLRTFLTTLAVVFGVLVIFGMNIVLPSMLQSLKTNTMSVSGAVDVTITHISSDVFPLEKSEKLGSIQGVSAVSPTLTRTINIPADYFDHDTKKADRITALILIGVNPEAAKSVNSYPMQSGRFLENSDTNKVIISQSLADSISINLGETISLPTVNGVESLEVIGILFPKTTPGNEEIIVNLAQAQTMMGQAGKINTIAINMDTLDQVKRDQIIAQIQSDLGDGYEIGSLNAGDEVFGAIQMGQIALTMFGVMALFMGAFIIFNTFRTVIVERRHDIGMLRAIGASRKTIRGLILAEGLVQGIVGTAFGLMFGYLLGAGVLKLAAVPMSQFINLQMGKPVISASIVIISILLGVGVTVLAGLIPAIQASRLTPLEALRPTSAEKSFKRLTGINFIIGILLIAVAVIGLFTGNSTMISLGSVLVLVGLVLVGPALVNPIAVVFGKILAKLYARQGTGELAQGNLTRQPSRVAITASATMLGIAIIVSLGGMVASMTITMDRLIRDGLGSDYLFIPPSISLWNSNVGANQDLATRLQAVDGVKVISTLRFSGTVVGDQAISVLGINPQTFPVVSKLEFVQGDQSAFLALEQGNQIIPNGILASTLGLKVGDELELISPKGKIAFTVAAVGSDLLNAKVNTVYMSQANLATYFDSKDDVFLQLNLQEGADAVKVDRQIKSIAADYPQFNVISGKEYAASMMTQLKAAFAGMYVLLALMALPSLIAMLNTLAISVLERTREIGMLRAVGATQKQVRTMVVTEALLLALIGTTFGILSGLYLGYMFVDALNVILPMKYVFPVAGVVAAIVTGLLFGMIAALIPAKQAAKMDVVKALQYE